MCNGGDDAQNPVPREREREKGTRPLVRWATMLIGPRVIYTSVPYLSAGGRSSGMDCIRKRRGAPRTTRS